MSQPVKLSDALVLEARIAADAQERSIAGQVEYWAKLGRSVAELLDGRAQQKLARQIKVLPLSELVETVEKPEGHVRLKAYLESEPFPHFEPHPTRKGLLVRIDANGHRTVGKFKNRQFLEVSDPRPELAPSRPALHNTRRAPASARAS